MKEHISMTAVGCALCIAAVVDDEGPVQAGAADNDKNNSSSGGDYVTCMEASVRPSVWIDLEIADLKM